MSDLSKKFIKGLKNYNLTHEDIINQNFKYCGGNTGSHHNYFKICFKNELKKNPNWMPDFKNVCICGHQISENCYIINDSNRILTLGNCCIKRFVPKSGRTCEICGESHRNRIINKCNNCRVGFCDKCNKGFDLTSFIIALIFPYLYIMYIFATNGTCGIISTENIKK